MPLTTGTRLGSYQIVDAIGSGGMGEKVYLNADGIKVENRGLDKRPPHRMSIVPATAGSRCVATGS